MINSVSIAGNLTRDPELRATSSGMSVMQFGVAVNDRAKNQQTGQWEDKPCFVDCVMFGSRAEKLAQYMNKGTKVCINGKLSYSSWQAQDGSKRSKLEVIVNDIELMGGKPSGAAQTASQPVMQPRPTNYPQQQQMAPQMAPQPVQQAMPQPVQVQQFSQPEMQMPEVASMTTASIYDEDIPF